MIGNYMIDTMFVYFINKNDKVCVSTRKQNHIYNTQHFSISFHINISNALLCFQIHLYPNKQDKYLGKSRKHKKWDSVLFAAVVLNPSLQSARI